MGRSLTIRGKRSASVRKKKRFFAAVFATALALSLSAPIAALAQPSTPPDLTKISLEDLMNIQVTSVSRKQQNLSRTGAAIFVISQDDIRRSGAANIPDVLRMVPGVNVARIDSNSWAIGIRGFNGLYSDKILVLIDGRSLYTPAFSGVLWDQVAVPLEDIERIEVIRGPGGTAWGANAMNGVINIITMSSSATQGGVVVAMAGSQESGSLVQYGGKAGTAGTYRVFGKYANTDSSLDPAGGAAADGWHAFQGGFRSDWIPSPQDKVMVQGDLYRTAEGQTVTLVLSNQLPAVATFNDPVTVSSGNLQTRWDHTLNNGSVTSLNVYYSNHNRLEQGMAENLNSFDLDFQHHIAVNSRNDVVWGLGYRVSDEHNTSGYSSIWLPPQRTDHLYTGFVQDEISIAESIRLTIGTKLEHNSYTGFEYEPSGQFVWTPTESQTIWLSASQAIRQPARQDTDLQFDVAVVPLQGGAFGVVKYINNKTIQAEQLRDYEAGYRAQLNKRFSLAVATFRSYYRNLENTVPGSLYFTGTPGPPHFVVPLILQDNGHARTYGGETFATWNVARRWRLSPGYSLIHLNMIRNPLDPGAIPSETAGATPKHQIQLRSALGLRSNLDWDTSLYFVGRLSDSGVPAYTRLDTQFRWRVRVPIEFSVIAQNLLAPRHAEFGNAYGVDYTEVRRSVIGKIVWKF